MLFVLAVPVALRAYSYLISYSVLSLEPLNIQFVTRESVSGESA